jgi:hypothetical protein
MMLDTWLRTVSALTPKPTSDHRVVRTAGQQAEHLGLALGQLRERRRAGRTAEDVEHPGGDPGSEQGLAPRDGPDGGDELVRSGSLQGVAVGAGPQGGQHVLVVVVHGQHQSPGRQS